MYAKGQSTGSNKANRALVARYPLILQRSLSKSQEELLYDPQTSGGLMLALPEEQAAQLAARDLDLMRRDVAAEKNLPPALARRLYGTTREELEQDADALVALLPDPQAPRTPKPDLSAGSTGDSGKPSSVADAMARYQARRERSGATT